MMSLRHFHTIVALRGDGLLPGLLSKRVQTETSPEPVNAKESAIQDSAREGVEAQRPVDLGEYGASRGRF